MEMDDERMVKISKFLSKYLRHQPEKLGLSLQRGGWVEVSSLLSACARQGFPITREELEEVVRRNNKQRFSFDPEGILIRANQGHSVAVDLQLEPIQPPEVLYHGTGHRAEEAIRQQGLVKMSRHHVHISADFDTARAVGARHGRPVVFKVDTRAMSEAGYVFYRSTNGVWLTDHVPAEYITE